MGQKVIILILTLGFLVLITKDAIKQDVWYGLYETMDSNMVHREGKFDSAESCKTWLNSELLIASNGGPTVKV